MIFNIKRRILEEFQVEADSWEEAQKLIQDPHTVSILSEHYTIEGTTGSNLRIARKKMNLTLEDVKYYTGMVKTRYKKIEADEIKPTSKELDLLNSLFGSTISL